MSRHVQCYLTRGQEHQTSYLPEKFAVPDRVVDLKEGDKWDRGWKVYAIYGPAIDSEVVLERSRDYKNQAKASDIRRAPPTVFA